jgi:TetR/AcrR family transcriptional repressor of mexJK operon
MEKLGALPHEKANVILDAAQKRFAVYGLNKVTMDEIAADVGMGKASLYYYFPAKENLFRAVIEREQLDFLGRLEEILLFDVSAAEKLKRYTEQRLSYFRELVNLNVFNLQSHLRARPVFVTLFESFASAERKHLTSILRSGKKSGEFVIRSPEATAALLLHLLQGLRLRASSLALQAYGQASVPDEVIRDTRHFVEIFIQGIRKSESR